MISSNSGRRAARAHFQPVGHASMKIGPRLLADGLVCGVVHEDVQEAEGVLARQVGGIGPDQVAAHERLKVSSD